MHDATDDVELHPRAYYVHRVKPDLPEGTFARAHSRVWRVPVHLALAIVGIVAIAQAWLPWPLVPVVSIAIGINFACLTFVAHEALHGGIVANRGLQYLVGWIGFVPFLVSPRLWKAWHNRDHHTNTQLFDDPDAYPTLVSYRADAAKRFAVDRFSLGGRRWRGVLSLVFGFSVQSANQLFSATGRGFISRRQQTLAFVESGLAVLLWASLAVIIGPLAFLFAYVLPLMVANACVMAFILTNHSLSPRLAVNDPLVGALSVTTARAIEWLTLGFGYHVEHHLFPAMSTRHAPAVRERLRHHWPGRYQEMSLASALRALHRTARVYKDATTLIDPTTGREFATLAPSPVAL